MSLRAVELLCLPEDQTAFLLDIGCGSGLSGEILEEEGHVWVGMDISKSMLESNIAVDKDLEGDLFLQDIGQGMGFRPGTFDGAIRYYTDHSLVTCIFTFCYPLLPAFVGIEQLR
ncbi:putative 18S rRNA (guanine-N(7))-methyltransferase [Zancudomyces culisetae]|uniref:Putative 18S rRNA (Guanine-N(7))-methyltransferase n=1 Tax=Zancudomyces culisetae TaxID=1213189 RepID=A0A1R1PGI4_ZANCU|nr:putative 18S rRNA (guanine-N(7))-methyltransferase [Zancudomyces culisetae]|eukprot:OMH80057.1 putative 18S rRNA (guanine-N(7))-methyltransferase [Zancudomyces culisetae]